MNETNDQPEQDLETAAEDDAQYADAEQPFESGDIDYDGNTGLDPDPDDQTSEGMDEEDQ